MAAKPTHGGRRKGAGRKPAAAAELRRQILAEADQVLCDQLVPLLGNMVKLANGGFKRVTERWELAALVQVDAVLRDKDGNPEHDARGNPVLVKQPLFPDAESDEMVLVGKSVEIAQPDRAAIQYLVDRMLGRPHTAEPRKPEEGRQPLPAILEAALARAYGDNNDKGGDPA